MKNNEKINIFCLSEQYRKKWFDFEQTYRKNSHNGEKYVQIGAWIYKMLH